MSLKKCPECEKEVSSSAQNCPHCGCPLAGDGNTRITAEWTNKSIKKKKLIGIGIVILGFFVFAIGVAIDITGIVGMGFLISVFGFLYLIYVSFLKWWNHG